MKTGELIRKLRTEKGLTQEQLGEMLGVQKSAIAKYENGRVENIKRTTLNKLATIFDISPLAFIDAASSLPGNAVVSVPVYSCLSCGTGSWIEERPEDQVGVPSCMMFHGRAFANFAEGDSMEPGIHNGDVLIFQETPDIESGLIGSFSLNGQYYCKRLRKLPDGSCWLFSDNPAYDPIPIGPDDDFRVLGLYKMKLSKEQ